MYNPYYTIDILPKSVSKKVLAFLPLYLNKLFLLASGLLCVYWNNLSNSCVIHNSFSLWILFSVFVMVVVLWGQPAKQMTERMCVLYYVMCFSSILEYICLLCAMLVKLNVECFPDTHPHIFVSITAVLGLLCLVCSTSCAYLYVRDGELIEVYRHS